MLTVSQHDYIIRLKVCVDLGGQTAEFYAFKAISTTILTYFNVIFGYISALSTGCAKAVYRPLSASPMVSLWKTFSCNKQPICGFAAFFAQLNAAPQLSAKRVCPSRANRPCNMPLISVLVKMALQGDVEAKMGCMSSLWRHMRGILGAKTMQACMKSQK